MAYSSEKTESACKKTRKYHDEESYLAATTDLDTLVRPCPSPCDSFVQGRVSGRSCQTRQWGVFATGSRGSSRGGSSSERDGPGGCCRRALHLRCAGRSRRCQFDLVAGAVEAPPLPTLFPVFPSFALFSALACPVSPRPSSCPACPVAVACHRVSMPWTSRVVASRPPLRFPLSLPPPLGVASAGPARPRR